MPQAARRPCPAPGCPGFCPCGVHVQQPWRSTTHAAPRRPITGRALQAARERLYRQQQGRCAACGVEVLFGSKSFIRDHAVPLAEAGLDVERNTQGLCATCSDSKTQAEAQRGMARWR